MDFTTEFTSNPDKYVLAYWPLRGRGAVPRMALILSGLPYAFDNTISSWPVKRDFEASAALYPLINMPYLRLPLDAADPATGRPVVLSQSGAILGYLGQRSPLLRVEADKDPMMAARVDEALCHIEDLWKELTTLIYTPDFEANRAAFKAKTVPYFFGALEQTMAAHGGAFVCGGKMTVADLALFEQVERLVDLEGAEAMAPYPKLAAAHAAVLALPQLKEYHAEAATLKFNGPGAHYSSNGMGFC